MDFKQSICHRAGSQPELLSLSDRENQSDTIGCSGRCLGKIGLHSR